MKAKNPCPICGSKYRLIEIRHYKDSKVDKAWKVRKCANCGYIISVKTVPVEEIKTSLEEKFKALEKVKAEILKEIDLCKTLINKLLE